MCSYNWSLLPFAAFVPQVLGVKFQQNFPIKSKFSNSFQGPGIISDSWNCVFCCISFQGVLWDCGYNNFPIEWTTACTVLISKETSQNRLIVHTCFVHQRSWLMHSCQNIWHWFLGYCIWMTTSCTNIPYLEQPGIGKFICLLVVVSWMDSYTYISPSQPPFWLWFHLGVSH